VFFSSVIAEYLLHEVRDRPDGCESERDVLVALVLEGIDHDLNKPLCDLVASVLIQPREKLKPRTGFLSNLLWVAIIDKTV
jgi:hypothetical protein